MKIKKFFIVLVLAVVLLGCSKSKPRHIVILLDVSGSIDRESRDQAFKAIDELANHLQRGDKITIIPILGDAETEAPGTILRYEVPSNRQAYDTDLRDFQSKLNASLKEMQTGAAAHPGAKTDIVGSIFLAGQELQSDLSSTGFLIVLSDFLQESPEMDFRRDNRLNSQSNAKHFAGQLCEKTKVDLQNIPVLLGLLRSHAYKNLIPPRRAAIQTFWLNYFNLLNSNPRFASDGLSALKQQTGL
jgi:hypothetical protein